MPPQPDPAQSMLTNIILLILGIVGGGVASWFVAQRFIHRPKLTIHLIEEVVLIPAEIDRQLQLNFAGNSVSNLVVLSLTITNKGNKDIVVPDALPPRPPNPTLQPSLDFAGFRIYAVRTLNNDQSRFYVTLAKANTDSRLFMNVSRIRANTTCQFQIIGTFTGNTTGLSANDVKLFPGAIPDIDIVSKGLIDRPWLTRQ